MIIRLLIGTFIFGVHICRCEHLWSSWSPWSKCTVTCGGGISSQFRTCLFPNKTECSGLTIRSKMCNELSCPKRFDEGMHMILYNHTSESEIKYHNNSFASDKLHNNARKTDKSVRYDSSSYISLHSNDSFHENDLEIIKESSSNVQISGGKLDDNSNVTVHDSKQINVRPIIISNSEEFFKNVDIQRSNVENNSLLYKHNSRHYESETSYAEDKFDISATWPFMLANDGGPLFKDRHSVTNSPSYVVSAWSVCSVTCGIGQKHRKVQCKILVPQTSIVQELPESECRHNIKPATLQSCTFPACDALATAESDYAWRFSGYGPCSRDCLGGIQVPIYFCIQLRTGAVTSDETCRHLPSLNVASRNCNEGPCEPRWRVQSYGSCSVTCGAGFRIRPVECVQQVSINEDDIVILPDSFCRTQTSPTHRVVCSTAACSPQWIVGPWTECKGSCRLAIQSRSVNCQQRLADGTVRSLPDSSCPQPKIDESVPCLPRHCLLSRTHFNSNATIGAIAFVQLHYLPSIRVRVRNRVTAVAGTNLTVVCPVPRKQKQQIRWYHGKKLLNSKGRVKVSNGGHLQIRRSTYNNKGDYVCTTGKSATNITVQILSEEEIFPLREVREALRENSEHFIESVEEMLSKMKQRRLEISFQELLRLFNVSQIPFTFVTGTWQPCSKTCGGDGFQVRQVTCEVILPSYSLIVDDGYCEQWGQQRPLDSQDCGFQRCPVWMASNWQECVGECIGNGVGTRKRSVLCMSIDGEHMENDACLEESIPPDSQPCATERCAATWRSLQWSKCSVSCGRGVQTRSVDCIWSANNQTAGTVCQRSKRPPLFRVCDMPPCVPMTDCKDLSQFCSMVNRLNMCRLAQYRQECCATCNHRPISERRRRLYFTV